MFRYISEEDKKYLSVVAIFICIALIVLFNMIFAPLVLLAILLYFINNKNNAITTLESAVIFLFAIPFVIYCIIARLFGMTIGVFAALPAVILGLLTVIYKSMGGENI